MGGRKETKTAELLRGCKQPPSPQPGGCPLARLVPPGPHMLPSPLQGLKASCWDQLRKATGCGTRDPCQHHSSAQTSLGWSVGSDEGTAKTTFCGSLEGPPGMA